MRVTLGLAFVVVAACAPHAEAPRSTQPTSGATSPRSGPSTSSDTDSALSVGTVVIDAPSGPLRFTVELALTDAQRQKGLMFRDNLDDEAGMLFIFPKDKVQSFWMRNTRIPLDMIFIAADGTIVGIVEDAEPLTLSSRKVDEPSRYVLEIPGGGSRKLGIAKGQRAHFAGVPTELVDARVISASQGKP